MRILFKKPILLNTYTPEEIENDYVIEYAGEQYVNYQVHKEYLEQKLKELATTRVDDIIESSIDNSLEYFAYGLIFGLKLFVLCLSCLLCLELRGAIVRLHVMRIAKLQAKKPRETER